VKRAFFVLIFLASFLFGESINVAAAANVSYAIGDLIKSFNKLHPDVKVRVTLGSSGKLTAQIEHGAPYHIFMSADLKYPQTLYKKGIALSKPLVYAKGSLALFSVKKRDFSKGLYILEDKDIKKIAVANPKTAPYGKAAFEALRNAFLLDKVKNKLIFGESVSQTTAYALKAADIGLIAKSALYSPLMKRFKEKENWIEVDHKLYEPIKQGAVIVNKGIKSKGAKEFFEFLSSKEAKEVFRNYGYLID